MRGALSQRSSARNRIVGAALAALLTSTSLGSPDAAAQDASQLVVAAARADRAVLSWTPPVGTARIRVLRDGRLLDVIRFQLGAFTYEDHLLWQATTYRYKVVAKSPSGDTLGASSATVHTPQQVGSFDPLYGPGSFFNQRIPTDAKPAANSDRMVSRALVRYADNANFANTNDWGIALAFADAGSRRYNVGCTRYDCDTSVSSRLPRYARPTRGSDHHLAVIDSSTREELDMWIAERNRNRWRAGSRFVGKADGWGALCSLGERCNGAVAAGFSLMGGVIRPEEIAQGHIDHALVFTTPFTRSGVIACPATHTDGKYDAPAAAPEGARIQLDPSFDVAATSWPRWKKVVARALQTYGAYLVDTGGTLAIRGEANINRGYDAWSLADTPTGASLSDLPWKRFRFLAFDRC